MKAKFKFIEKWAPDATEFAEAHPAMVRGSALHAMQQAYLTGKYPKLPDDQKVAIERDFKKSIQLAVKGTLPPELKSFAKEYKTMRDAMPITEAEWAVTELWMKCGWFDRAGQPKVWKRDKVDAHYFPVGHTLVIQDLKSGKNNKQEEHDLQLSCYAVSGFALYPAVTTIRVELWYVDQGEERIKIFTRAEFGKLKKFWETKLRPYNNDRRFAPKPSGQCKWCDYAKENGGPCKH